MGGILQQQEVQRLQRKRNFQIRDEVSGKIYTFSYDENDVSLFIHINGRKFKVLNPGNALYAFVEQKSSFELHIDNEHTYGIPGYLALSNISVIT